MQNPNFIFGKKKKAWFAKNFAFKNQVLGIKLKTSFSKRDFEKKKKKHGKEMGSQTDPKAFTLKSRQIHNFIYPLHTFNFFQREIQ
jgi:hypothetical protein